MSKIKVMTSTRERARERVRASESLHTFKLADKVAAIHIRIVCPCQGSSVSVCVKCLHMYFKRFKFTPTVIDFDKLQKLKLPVASRLFSLWYSTLNFEKLFIATFFLIYLIIIHISRNIKSIQTKRPRTLSSKKTNKTHLNIVATIETNAGRESY